MPKTRRPYKLTAQQTAISMQELANAIDYFGSISRLAEVLGIQRQNVSAWRKGKYNIPIDRAVEMDRLTQGKIKKEKLRPDYIWWK